MGVTRGWCQPGRRVGRVPPLRTLREFRERLRLARDERAMRARPSRFGVALFDSIHHAPGAAWEAVVPPARVPLRLPYLAALEASRPADLRFRYALLYDGRRPVAAASVQVIALSGGSVGSRAPAPAGDEAAARPLARLVDAAKATARKLAEGVEYRLLLCGNAFLSGEHGFCHTADVSPEEAFHGLADALYRIRRADKLHGEVGALMVKDFHAADGAPHPADQLAHFGYRSFAVDPTMAVPLRPEWRTFDDYVAAMTGKYRRRVRDVRKKGRALQRRDLSVPQLEAARDRMAALLDAVAHKAKFRLTGHPPDYFVALKQALGDGFRVTGYYLDSLLVGFTSTLAMGDDLEGHYLGLDYAHNRAHDLYQNILYDDVAAGIERGARQVWLGRTALEIKSGIGAEPRPLRCFVRHRTGVGNRALKPLFGFIKPAAWTARNPFSDSAAAAESD